MEKIESTKNIPTPKELAPKGLSVEGFLKEGQTLEMILERDRKVLVILDYTAQEVADLLANPLERAARGGDFSYTAQNGKEYEIEVQAWRGTQNCPWKDKVDWRKSSGAIDLYFIEKGKNEEVRIPGLLRHLIEAHGFFEGGSYRVSPEKLVEMFGVEKIPGSLEKAKEIPL